jgi:hypothetical protein
MFLSSSFEGLHPSGQFVDTKESIGIGSIVEHSTKCSLVDELKYTNTKISINIIIKKFKLKVIYIIIYNYI